MALKTGDQGAGVTVLQENLNQLGVAKLQTDGIFGPATFAALETFQSAHSLPVTGQLDGATYDAINKALSAQLGPTPAPWLAWMKGHIGEIEQTGAAATDFDNEVFSHTSYGNLDGVMEAGCAATACAALEESGFKSPHNAAAASFINFGEKSDLVPGAIVVFQWESGDHHVTFCDHVIDVNLVACLGGNQSHQVKVSVFSRKYIVWTGYPIEKLDGTTVKPQT